jgi:steroid delta-isomerase-like uncharacterized protein
MKMSFSTSPRQIRQLVNELYAAWSLHEPDRIDAIFSDDAAYEDVAGGQVLRGKIEIKQLLRVAFGWAPDFGVTMTSLTIAGDTGTTEWVIEGTQSGPVQAGPLGELPATGRTFRLRGASILVFRGGRIVRVTDYYDMATFLRQLGATFAAPKP